MAGTHFLPKGILTRAAAGALLAFLLAGGVSCDLFETRTPNDPGGIRFPCATLDFPSNVFTNIVQAYGRGDGIPCYVSNLSDVLLVFDFDEVDSLDNPAQFQSWTKDIEQRVAQNIASGAESFFLQFKIPYTSIDSQPDVQTRQYTYEIRFKGTAISDTLFQGLATITVRKNLGGQWLVESWVDRPDPAGTTPRTWGYLRGQYRIGF